MAIPLAHTTFGANNTPSSAIDTSGASIIFIAVSGTTTTNNPPTDSKGNTWHLIATVTQNSGVYGLYAAYGPGLVVGTGHTAQDLGPNAGYICAFFAFSGFDGPADKSSTGVANFRINCQPGSITPSFNGELIVSVFWNTNHGPTTSVDSGITMFDNVAAGGSGISPGYLVQTTAAAINPTWNSTSAGFNAAVIASFPALVMVSGGTNSITLVGCQ